eukprot:CAMPEP_0180420888 /NCGR_PEP_ID=MMETSP1036_2-20121128/2865_1 /TAXON_ID=632150 /ORGANISM="Azadinium spinosum, Strain 3D9" /LENGTH=59 /DNA_ID=CAMNT_0022426131 /DNA_START=583 /DNA_END=763 /DNA_ORIENTATION=-
MPDDYVVLLSKEDDANHVMMNSDKGLELLDESGLLQKGKQISWDRGCPRLVIGMTLKEL